MSIDAPFAYATGWVPDPAAVAEALPRIAAAQSCPVSFAEAHPVAADPDRAVCLWLAEDRVRGRRMPTWDQRQVGSCVSFGTGRAVNDLVMQLAAAGRIDAPATDVATEPIYGGSRIEVGGGRIRGDGSVGAWAAEWLLKWGVILRGVYGPEDLREYSEDRCRRYGSRGCPDDLEPVARQRPVKAAAMAKTPQELWDAIGSGYPGQTCSIQGFATQREEGFLRPQGRWGHCMEVRGRVIARRNGRDVRAFIEQNSWQRNWLSGDPYCTDAVTGQRIELPEGCFLIDWDTMAGMLAEEDSFVFSAIDGFPKREPEELPWLA